MQIVTWNIQRARGPDGHSNVTRLAADLRRFADPDVICLQEVSAGHTDLAGCDGSNQFVELAAQFPDYVSVAAVGSDTAGDAQHCSERRLFGCMLLTRYPVLQVFRHNLPWPVDPEVISMQRVALEATLATPSGPLRVTTTHLEYFSATQRTAQVERLRELHAEASGHARYPHGGGAGPFAQTPRASSAVLTGDFNFAPRSAHYMRMLARFHDHTHAYVDAWRHQHGPRSHAPTVCLHARPTRPADPFTSDFIFVTGDLAERQKAIEVIADDFGPDHQPLLLQLD